jgi:hypothetical protein
MRTSPNSTAVEAVPDLVEIEGERRAMHRELAVVDAEVVAQQVDDRDRRWRRAIDGVEQRDELDLSFALAEDPRTRPVRVSKAANKGVRSPDRTRPR